MILVGILSALGLLLLALKVGGRKAIGNDVFVDVVITVTLLICFYGTFSGTTAAMVGGLCASIVLFVMKKTMTHETLAIKTKKVFNNKISVPYATWETHKPKWRR